MTFTVPGIARPGGSKRGIPFRKKDGSLGVRVIESGTHTAAWRDLVTTVAAVAMQGEPPLEGPLRLVIEFRFTRPKGHLGAKGNVKASAPRYPAVTPDTTKLVRALEDSLSGTVWYDDAQVVRQTASKDYAERNEAVVTVSEM